MSLRKITLEHTFYSLIFFTAVFLRLLNLGAFPLSDQEAGWALLAQQFSQASLDRNAYVGSQPAYLFLTGISFLLFNTSNFLARFWPAFMGSTLVLTPFLFRKKLGRETALILACALALDPGLIAISRQAGSSMLALSFTALALGFCMHRKALPTGIFAGLALLSGQAIWHAILVGLIGWAIFKNKLRTVASEDSSAPQPFSLKLILLTCLATMIVCSTFFCRYPQGITGWANSLTEFITITGQPAEISGWRLLVTTWVYQPLAWLFALAAIIRTVHRWIVSKIQPGIETIILIACALLSISFTLIYPRHAPGDLVWFIYLLWTIAAWELSKWLEFKENPVISFIQAGLVFLFGAMFWNTLSSVSQLPPQAGVPWALLQALVLTGILGLAGLSAILVAYTWSWSISRSGLAAGAIAISIVYSLAAIWSAAQIRPNSAAELWNPGATIAQTDLLIDTIHDLSVWQTGMQNNIDIVATVDTPAMRWLLRDFINVRYLPEAPTAYQPTVLITSFTQDNPSLSIAYRGQDFPWQIQPGWAGALPDSVIPWLTSRKAAEQKTWLILWARTDLFLGEQLSNQPNLNE
jgi:hypothetical protein